MAFAENLPFEDVSVYVDAVETLFDSLGID